VIELIVTAVVAGAAAGTTTAASTAVTDAYKALKAGIRRVLSRRAVVDAEVVDLVAAVEAAPDRRAELESALVAVGADEDADLLAAARRVLELVDPDGARLGKYAGMHVHDNEGVIIGDHTNATFHFGQK
jgi:hypothetical protein